MAVAAVAVLFCAVVELLSLVAVQYRLVAVLPDLNSNEPCLDQGTLVRNKHVFLLHACVCFNTCKYSPRCTLNVGPDQLYGPRLLHRQLVVVSICGDSPWCNWSFSVNDCPLPVQMVIACWCQREAGVGVAPPLSSQEKTDLQFLYEEWAHPFFISIQEFCRLMEVRLGRWPGPVVRLLVNVQHQWITK
jgi:hypothetical protein